MIVQEKPDGVAIAVVPQHQYEIARYALENGIVPKLIQSYSIGKSVLRFGFGSDFIDFCFIFSVSMSFKAA